jgi:hypothetical protein
VAEPQLDVVRLLRILDPDEPLCLSGRLVALGDHCGDHAAVRDPRRLEQRQFDVVDLVQPRRVFAREDGENARSDECPGPGLRRLRQPRPGHVPRPVNADVEEIEALWIEEHDPLVNPIGAKGIGEIGIVGTAAAIGNAVHHASGIRIRDLPIRPDKLLRVQA